MKPNLDNYKAVIFDFDGTLVESMVYMEEMLIQLLEDRGKTPKDELIHEIKPLGFHGGAKYLKETYNLNETPDEIFDYMFDEMYKIYRDKIEFKPGSKEYIKDLKEQGKKIAIASANQKPSVVAGINRNNMGDLIDLVITIDELETDKSSPKIFEYVSEKFGTKPEETVVFEDSALAIKVAKDANFYTIGIKENSMEEDEERLLREESHLFIEDFLD